MSGVIVGPAGWSVSASAVRGLARAEAVERGAASIADDCASEAVIRMLRFAGKFRGQSDREWWTFITRVVQTAVIDTLRADMRHSRCALQMDAQRDNGATLWSSTYTPWDDIDTLICAADEIRRISAGRWVILAAMGYTAAEAAEITELTVPAVKCRVARGRAALARRVGMVEAGGIEPP